MSDEELRGIVADAIWAGFEADDNVCADRELDIIDTSSWEPFSMPAVAQRVIDALRAQGVLR